MFKVRSGARTTAPPSSLPVFPFLGALLFVIPLIGCSQPASTTGDDLTRGQITLTGQTMGTSYHVKIVVTDSETHNQEELKQEIDEELSAFNDLLSTWDPKSELSQFNLHASTDPFPVSRETIEIVKASFELYEQSDGAFDPTVGPLIEIWGFGSKEHRTSPPSPMEISTATATVGMNRLLVGEDSLTKTTPGLQLNLSAIAKGYGVDVIARVLEDRGFEDVMVEIGGEVVVRGKNLKRQPWTIGVDSPTQTPGRRELIEVLALDNCAIATSGDYRNAFEYDGVLYSHIINPKTGWPIPESVKSVTVIAPTCMLADGAATTIMAMGVERGLAWAEKRKDLEALLFVKDDEQGFARFQTSGMEDYFLKDSNP